jgi:hypothetical protein
MTVEPDLIILHSVCLEGHMVILNVNFGTHILLVRLFSKIFSQSSFFFAGGILPIFQQRKWENLGIFFFFSFNSAKSSIYWVKVHQIFSIKLYKTKKNTEPKLNQCWAGTRLEPWYIDWS